jgi:hypothetical protein
MVYLLVKDIFFVRDKASGFNILFFGDVHEGVPTIGEASASIAGMICFPCALSFFVEV